MAEYLNVPNRTLFIGDNLPVLRGLNTDAVDLIYLDPPRNRGGVVRGRKYNGKYLEYNDTWTADDMRPEWIDEISVRCPDALLAINGAKLLHGVEMAGYLTFMTVRLLELQRVLRPSGSIYLQTDPHTLHYLRTVMDAIFGSDNFMNQIAWRRNRIGRAGGKRWAWSHDTLLFYTGPRDKYHWNLIAQEPPPEYWKYYEYSRRERDEILHGPTGPPGAEGGRFERSMARVGPREGRPVLGTADRTAQEAAPRDHKLGGGQCTRETQYAGLCEHDPLRSRQVPQAQAL